MRDGFAIVGMASLFPGAPDLSTYWGNIRAGVDAITAVPPGRMDPVFLDAAASGSDRFYCKRGGFVDEHASFDPLAHGIMPVAARGAEPDQLLALELATRALADAGYHDRAFARDKAGVIIGRGNYAGVGRTRLEQHVRTAEQLVQALRALVPGLSAAQLGAVRTEFQTALGQAGPDAAIGLVPNLTASRIANRLDLAGPAFTVDAACASALVAVDQACGELASGRCDLVIAGGVHLCHDEAFWSVFCQLGALSRNQQIRPFDRRADGLLIGEGIGLVVLKRRADAERDDDQIYAVIRGTGLASDGRASSLMNPRVDGQLLALARAWQAAGLDPATVELVEAHGTATPAGDAAELETLRRFFGTGERAVLGSVKSMIGHTMPAAGAAGLIKAALALSHRELPPTLHCEEPNPSLAETRFRVIGKTEPWDRLPGATGPRRAAVNAFGFGGIDAHLVLEEVERGGRRSRPVAAPVVAEERVLCLAANSAAELVAMLEVSSGAAVEKRGAGSCRVALLDPTPTRLARAKVIVERGLAWRGREGIWFSPQALLHDGGKLAFVYPGLDASFRPRVDDLAAHFGLTAPAAVDPGEARRGLPAEGRSPLIDIEEVGYAIVGVNRLVDQALQACGVRADFMLGHSIGEWSGMIAAGMIPPAALEPFIAGVRGQTLEVPGVAFGAAGCSAARATEVITDLPQIALSHDNCPHQVILCGIDASIDTALARLTAAGVLCQKLPFRSGFHSPLFAPYLTPHRTNFASLPFQAARVPLFSATTCAPYPDDEPGIRALALRHLVEPVRFRELVLALHEQGARVFVQVGTGSLPGFIEDTLRGQPHAAIAANLPAKTGVEQLRRVLLALFVEGLDPDLNRLAPAAPTPAPSTIHLALGVPLVRQLSPLAMQPSAQEPAPIPANPLAAAFRGVLDEIALAQSQVLAGFEARAGAPSRAPALAARAASHVRVLSLDTLPELIDHTFFRQPPGWKTVSDRHPVVPMTTSIQLMIEAAAALVPELVVVGVEDVQAFRWLVVSSPVDATITAKFDGRDQVSVSIEGYSSATIRLAEGYPAAPAAPQPLEHAHPAPISAERLYVDRWMFHGAAYQGIVELGPIADRAIAGTIETGAAKGSLLDNAGQLYGYWIMLTHEIDRMAMPVRIDRLSLFGPHPAVGTRLRCTVWIRKIADREVVADLTLHDAATGRVWAVIEGWEDRRFDTDARLWPVMVYPEKNLLAEPHADGYVRFNDRYRAAATRDQLARRFLGERERAVYEAQGPRGQRSWLNGRIAAKDAVRAHLWHSSKDAIFPVEVEIQNDAKGRPLVVSPAGRDLRVSIAHKGELAVARVAEGRDVGIDLEYIEPRPDGFAELAFHDDELALVGAGEDRDEWMTRLWAAKEAVGKLRGVGLEGNPRKLRVTNRTGERLLADGVWVETRRESDHIIAWTVA